jgi:hypothetical protein
MARAHVHRSAFRPSALNLRTPGRLAALVALAVGTLGLPGTGRAATPEDLSYCGAYNQRACCLWEADDSCDGSLTETGAIGGTCSGFGVPAGLCGYSTPGALTSCGGDAQRACCVGETAVLRGRRQ